MNDLLKMSDRATCEDSRSVISLQGSAFGASHCEPSDGPTIAESGRDLVRVNLSPRQAKEKGLLTSGTYGRRGTGLSRNARKRSAILARSLVNKLRVKTALLGSTLFNLTWKESATPSGRQIFRLRASVRRTSDNASTSWQSPNVTDGGSPGTINNYLNKYLRDGKTSSCRLRYQAHLVGWPSPTISRGDSQTRPDGTTSLKLAGAVQLANWRSPQGSDGEGGVMEIREGTAGKYKLRDEVHLSSWGTPNALDTISRAADRPSRAATGRKAGYLTEQINLASWVTPTIRDYKDSAGMSETGTNPDGSIRSRLDQLPRQAQLADLGPTQTGSTAETKNSGQLNAAHSRWLMGFHAIHDLLSPGFASWALIQTILNGSSSSPELIALAVSEATAMPLLSRKPSHS